MPPSLHDVRPATVRVVVAAVALATTLVAAALAKAPVASWWPVLLVAVTVAGGEALRVTLPFRGGHVARFGQSDAVVLAALVLLPVSEVTIGACLGVGLWHLLDRLAPVKLAFNVAQFTASTASAAFVYRALVPQPGTAAIAPETLVPYAVAAVVFLLVGTILVGAVVSTVVDGGVGSSVRRLLPASAVVTVGGAGLGLLALGLMPGHVYLLPTMGVPLLFVMAASRQQVEAQLREERSRALVDVERALAGARSVAEVDRTLVDGIGRVVNASAAVWREGAWSGALLAGAPLPVPPAGDPRRCDPREWDLDGLLGRRGEHAVAVEVGGGVAVAWGGDLGLIDETAEWVTRLARSAADELERSAAHAALVQERATLRSVIDGTSDGIYVLDADGRILLVNPAMAALVGSTEAELRGDPVESGFGPGAWRSPGVHDVERRDAGGVAVWRVGVTALEEAGVAAVRVGVVHDVSADRRLARMKDDMLAVVSHELRTPLTPIRAAAGLLAARWDRVDADTRTRLLDQVRDRADHLTRLVEDLLLVAQLSGDDGRAPAPALAAADVAVVLRHDVDQQDAARAGHRIAFEGPARLPAVTDARRLRQIVDNLVDNACKFSPEGTTVTVRVAAGPGVVHVSVADHGRGIATGDLDRIFERFARLEDPAIMQTSGAGLGLYIVRSLVAALGGALDVTSEVGLGTTMTVTLPLGLPGDVRSAAGVDPEGARLLPGAGGG